MSSISIESAERDGDGVVVEAQFTPDNLTEWHLEATACGRCHVTESCTKIGEPPDSWEPKKQMGQLFICLKLLRIPNAKTVYSCGISAKAINEKLA